jgi:hypothetical protein
MTNSPLIRPATDEDAFYVAAHLQQADKDELDGWGDCDYDIALLLSVYESDNPITFINPLGEICGVAGVSRTDAHSGSIWMLTTDHVRGYPTLFFKEAKKWVSAQTEYDLLYNVADPRNRLHMKLLHMLGFKRLGYQSVGPRNLTYVEFAKLTSCAYQQQQPHCQQLSAASQLLPALSDQLPVTNKPSNKQPIKAP